MTTTPTFSRRQLAQLFAGAAVAPAVAIASTEQWPHRTGVHRQQPAPKIERILIDVVWQMHAPDEYGMISGHQIGRYLYPDGRIEEHELEMRQPIVEPPQDCCSGGEITITTSREP